MILERESELSELARLLDDAGEAGGRVVLIRGEAGIGKSTLISRFLMDVDARADTLLGACDDLLTPQPMGPIWDVARSAPSLLAPLAAGDRRAVMEGLLALMSRCPRPTVVVLEDTQWADEATLDLVTFLGRRIARTNGLLLLTYRDVEVDTDHVLRRVIGELPTQNVVRMALGRLSPDAVGSMMHPASFDIDAVMALTGGNPLFVTEVVAAGTDTVPLSVADAVLARAAKLSPGARRLLDVVAVVPGKAERPLVDRLVHVTDDFIAECRRQGFLVVDDGAMSFAHELQRRAIESSLSSTDRRRLNQQVLAHLIGTADPARLVHHASGAEDGAAIVEFAPRAARAAMAMGSAGEAVAHFRTLAPYLDGLEVGERAAIYFDWATQEYLLAHREAVELADHAIDLQRSTGDDVALARMLTMASRINATNRHSARALECSDEAISLLEPWGPSRDLARALAHRANLVFSYEDRDEWVLPIANRAISVAREVGDDEALARALSVKGYLIYSRGDVHGLSLMDESLQVAQRAGDQLAEVIALSNIAGMHGDVRDVARAIDFAQRARDTAARYEIRWLEFENRSMHAEFLLWKGDWEAAENAAADLLGSSPGVEEVATRVLGTIQARRGRKEARTAVMRMWSLAENEPGPGSLDPAASALAEYLWLSGEQDPELVARLREVFASCVALGRPWPSGPFAFWMWKLGLLDSVPEGSSEFYRWIIDGDHARAARFWHGKGIPYEEGLALMHGDEAEQVEAIRIFEDLGAAAAAAIVRRSLAHQGARVPRGKSLSTRDHPAGLTARQAEVLSLLALGHANTQIAHELFVSQRTVENHVAAILMKLDVATRESAVAAARRRGILADP